MCLCCETFVLFDARAMLITKLRQVLKMGVAHAVNIYLAYAVKIFLSG
jgi:hypothetical protein